MRNIDKMIIGLGAVISLMTAANAICASDVDMGGNTISNVADPVADTDVVNKRFFYDTLKEGYIRDDAKNVVIQISSGLMWQDDTAVESVQKKWLTPLNYYHCNNSETHCEDTAGDTAATYCKNLSLGGFSDWRLPSKEELYGILKSSVSQPKISAIFQHTVSSYYWSSTATANSSVAWLVRFNSGDPGRYHKNRNTYVRCVRAEQ